MSTRRGGVPRGQPKHLNTFAFRHNPNSRLTEHIMALPVKGLCKRCHDIVEWRKRYRKYKPLSQPKKWCVTGACATAGSTMCGERKVVAAYHVICDDCAEKSGTCAKCRASDEIVAAEAEVDEAAEELEELLKGPVPGIRERERRAMIRALQRELEEKRKALEEGTSAAPDPGDEGVGKAGEAGMEEEEEEEGEEEEEAEGEEEEDEEEDDGEDDEEGDDEEEEEEDDDDGEEEEDEEEDDEGDE